MSYGIFVEDDILDEYDTHQECLWHLMNDVKFDCGNISRRDIYTIKKIEDFIDCPQCNSRGSVVWDGDTYWCPLCNYIG